MNGVIKADDFLVSVFYKNIYELLRPARLLSLREMTTAASPDLTKSNETSDEESSDKNIINRLSITVV
jgi:hypothetical protein